MCYFDYFCYFKEYTPICKADQISLSAKFEELSSKYFSYYDWDKIIDDLKPDFVSAMCKPFQFNPPYKCSQNRTLSKFELMGLAHGHFEIVQGAILVIFMFYCYLRHHGYSKDSFELLQHPESVSMDLSSITSQSSIDS